MFQKRMFLIIAIQWLYHLFIYHARLYFIYWIFFCCIRCFHNGYHISIMFLMLVLTFRISLPVEVTSNGCSLGGNWLYSNTMWPPSATPRLFHLTLLGVQAVALGGLRRGRAFLFPGPVHVTASPLPCCYALRRLPSGYCTCKGSGAWAVTFWGRTGWHHTWHSSIGWLWVGHAYKWMLPPVSHVLLPSLVFFVQWTASWYCGSPVSGISVLR